MSSVVEIAAGISVNLYLLAGLGTAVGLIAGFVGVSGGYLLTPILIIMGFPAPLAVGTGLALMTANTLVAVIRHRRLGHLDLKMGLITAAGTMLGAEVGVRLLHVLEAYGDRAADIVVLGTLLATLILVGGSMLREVGERSAELANGCEESSAAEEGEVETAACRFLQSLIIFPHIRFTKSKLRISGWIVLLLGIVVGVLSGFLGVGGSFMLCPSLIYLVGQPSMMAVGTNLIGAFVGVAFGCFRHATFGNVELGIALAMLLGMSLGTLIGAKGTSCVRGLAVRYVLAASVIAACFGPACKMVYFLTDAGVWNQAAKIVTVAQISIPVTMIIVLLVMARRHVRGQDVPDWAGRLMAGGRHAAAG
ncbi:MAG: sulfite exporter TauE/SafE family protein [Armatimonadota bacterium]